MENPLRKVIYERKMSVNELVKRGMSSRTVYGILNGRTQRIRIQTLEQIGELLETDGLAFGREYDEWLKEQTHVG